MERILIFYTELISHQQKTIWVHLDQTIQEFLDEIEIEDCQTTYQRFFYHLETKSKLNEKLTWNENFVVSGDHIIYV